MQNEEYPQPTAETTGAVIAAAGSSSRMGGVDKIFALLEGRAVLAHSVAAFEDTGTQRRIIEVSSEITDLRWSLSVSDSGPDIVGIPEAEIWLPGQTTRRSGTGLGLTIVRDAAHDLGGTVRALENGPLGGAVFTVQLPIIGA